MAIPLSDCVFCKKEYLLRDINRDMVLFGDSGRRLDEGVCLSCSEDLFEIPAKELDSFSYSKLVRVSDLEAKYEEFDKFEADEFLPAKHRIKQRKGLKVLSKLLLVANRDKWDFSEWRERRKVESMGFRAFRRSKGADFKSNEEVNPLIDEIEVDSSEISRVNCVYKISLDCVLGEKCEGISNQLMYTGKFAEMGLDLPLKNGFPQRFSLSAINCCGEVQGSLEERDESGFFCSNSDDRKHDCKCKKEEFDEDVRETWREWERGHQRRGSYKTTRARECFLEACEDNDLDAERTRLLLRARYSSLRGHAGPYPTGEWLEPVDRRCARLEECRIPAESIVESFEIAGRMTGSGYICEDCWDSYD